MDIYFGHPTGNKIILDEDESNHLLNVKRVRNGEIVYVTDGKGYKYKTELFQIEKRTCILNILETNIYKKNSNRLHLAIAPTKSIDRIEWLLEKATETGIDEISFILCRHSERKEIKIERLNKVLVSSMKQSTKTFLPKINSIVDYKSFISKNNSGIKLICTMNIGENENFKKNYLQGNDLIVLIGPEGDFHPEEISLANQFGFKSTSLGSSRLRTETAALNVCTLFNFINSF